uniref:Putative LOC100197594 [Hydra vulgaris] n=1 Tax=Lepeophtheirus salmonis TaxID=72036 RepID=A0A0K2U181_LEPSM
MPKGSALYIDLFKVNFLFWVQVNFLMATLSFSKMGPAYTLKINQTFLANNITFSAKRIWSPYSPDVNPLGFSFWSYIERWACNISRKNFEAMPPSTRSELPWIRTSLTILVALFARGL